MLTETNASGEDGYFNPEFTEVDRILDVRIVCNDASRPLQREDPELQSLLPEEEFGQRGSFFKEFLVKWRGIQYSDITWEVFSDFQNPAPIKEYYMHEWVVGRACYPKETRRLAERRQPRVQTVADAVQEGDGEHGVQEQQRAAQLPDRGHQLDAVELGEPPQLHAGGRDGSGQDGAEHHVHVPGDEELPPSLPLPCRAWSSACGQI